MKLIAQKEADAFVKSGAKEFRYNREIRLTPGAKDIFSEAGIKLVFDAESAITVSTQIYGKVDGVDLSGTTPALRMGSLAIDLTSVKAIDNPPPATIP